MRSAFRSFSNAFNRQIRRSFSTATTGAAAALPKRSTFIAGTAFAVVTGAGAVIFTQKNRTAAMAEAKAGSTAAASDPISEATARAAAKLGLPPTPLTGSADLSSRVADGMVDMIGWTPLVELKSVSQATGCRIVAKCEFMNAGGSVKDRPAKFMIEAAEADGRLKPGSGIIIEGTGGNTGIGLALIARAKGYRCILTMPSNVSAEKIQTMKDFGAEVTVVPAVPYTDPNHFMHLARKLAESTPGAFFTNQFDNSANALAHYHTTGPEVARQVGGVDKIDALCVMAGTGGTISGLTNYFKERNAKFKSYLIDCHGSGYANYVLSNEFKSDGLSTVLEGVGISRKTANFELVKPLVDGVFWGSDREAIEMCYYLLKHEGLFVGPSAAMNVVGAVKLAKKLGPGHTILTVLCDGGDRY